MKAAIVVPTYNRVDDLTLTLRSIDVALRFVERSYDVIVSIDGGSSQSIIRKCVDNLQLAYQPQVIEHEEHFGLKGHILWLGKLTAHHDYIIVLEDDVVVSPLSIKNIENVIDMAVNTPEIAAISLYSFQYGDFIRQPIYCSELSVFWNLVQSGSSWGQVWWSDNWQQFESHIVNQKMDAGVLPCFMQRWSERSWKKLFNHWLIKEQKYCLFPQKSLAVTTGGKTGTHNLGIRTACFSEVIATNDVYFSSDDWQRMLKFDAFLELEMFDNLQQLIQEKVGFTGTVELDLYGLKEQHQLSCDFVITIQPQVNPLRAWGNNLGNPILSVLMDQVGSEIFLVSSENFTRRAIRNYKRFRMSIPYLGKKELIKMTVLDILNRL